MQKCKFCGAVTENENGVCHECRTLFDFIRSDNLEERVGGFCPEVCEGWRLPSFLCYIPFLFWIPYLVCRRSPYVRFHANQGLLFSILTALCGAAGYAGCRLCAFGMSAVGTVSGYLLLAFSLLVWCVYMIWGMVSAMSGSGSILPIIGKLRLLR